MDYLYCQAKKVNVQFWKLCCLFMLNGPLVGMVSRLDFDDLLKKKSIKHNQAREDFLQILPQELLWELRAYLHSYELDCKLYQSICDQDSELVKDALEKKANPNAYTNTKMPFLWQAFFINDDACLKSILTLLLQYGADPTLCHTEIKYNGKPANLLEYIDKNYMPGSLHRALYLKKFLIIINHIDRTYYYDLCQQYVALSDSNS